MVGSKPLPSVRIGAKPAGFVSKPVLKRPSRWNGYRAEEPAKRKKWILFGRAQHLAQDLALGDGGG